MPATITSTPGRVTGEEQSRRHRHRLEVSTEGVAGGHGHVEEAPIAQAGDEVAQRDRQGAHRRS